MANVQIIAGPYVDPDGTFHSDTRAVKEDAWLDEVVVEEVIQRLRQRGPITKAIKNHLFRLVLHRWLTEGPNSLTAGRLTVGHIVYEVLVRTKVETKDKGIIDLLVNIRRPLTGVAGFEHDFSVEAKHLTQQDWSRN